MTWALGPSGEANGRLIEYECKMNSFFPGYDISGICQYNRKRFRPETLMHVIRTHPLLIFKGQVCENPYYLPPEIVQGGTDGLDDRVQKLLESMSETERLRGQLIAEMETLRRSQKLAAAGRMAATIAHEISNPLETAANLCDLLSEENLSPEGRGYVETMAKELERVSQIAQQSLGFYRVDAPAAQVDVRRVIKDATKSCARQAKSNGTSIEVQHRGPGITFGFPAELCRVFANLIANSLEAGASRILIRTAEGRDWRRPWRRGVRITIGDDGTGVPAAMAGKIFEPFFTTKEEKGKGLGLWVSKGIVQKHEGLISMRTSTRSGRSGTVFSILLPA